MKALTIFALVGFSLMFMLAASPVQAADQGESPRSRKSSTFKSDSKGDSGYKKGAVESDDPVEREGGMNPRKYKKGTFQKEAGEF